MRRSPPGKIGGREVPDYQLFFWPGRTGPARQWQSASGEWRQRRAMA
jgi:hypothetical protein